MKKRLQCLLLALVLVASVFTVACSNEEEPDTITLNGSNKAPATTVTIWGIRGDNTTDEAVALVEEAMSAVTQSEFNTALQLNLYTKDEYLKALDERLDEIADQKKIEQAELDRLEAINKLYKNSNDEETVETVPEDVTSINEIGLVEIIYPEPDAAQLDIFYIPDQNSLISYVEEEHISALDTELSSTGKLMTSYIHPNILGAGKINNVTYAIINNKPVGKYTYMLLNKAMLDKYYYDASDITTFKLADEFIMDIAKNEPGMVPLLGEFDPIGVQYFTPDGKESVVGNMLPGSAQKNKSAYGVPSILFSNNNYVDHMRQIKKYQSLGYIGNGTAEIGDFAVGIVKCDVTEILKYQDEYEVVVLQKPYIDNDIYKDMFAISSYTKDISRSMEVLNAINTNSELRNIFAYGVKDVHYTLDENGVVSKLNNDYDTPIECTGNVFITYPPEGSSPTVWEDCKGQNLEIVEHPYFGFDYVSLADEETMKAVAEISEAYFNELDAIPYSQFDSWLENAIAELKENPVISSYISFEETDESLASKYNEWFFKLFPDAML